MTPKSAERKTDMAENTNLETEMTEQTAPEAEAKPAGPSLEELAAQVASLTEALNKQKKATDNASSDAASWKAKFRATQSEAERAEAERAEAERQLRAENEALKRDRTVSAYSNRALALGYDADLAAATAEAMANGNMDAVFDGIGQLIAAVKTKTATENLSRQPSLSTGTPPTASTVQKDEENKMRKWMGLNPKK